MDKAALLAYIKDKLQEKINAAWTAMSAAQESANEQGKSSMGDKYETSRSMGQLDRDMHARQYEQARQERVVLERIRFGDVAERIALGSLVETSSGWFFISVSLGVVSFEGQKIMAVSPASPVGMSLVGKKKGDRFVFMNKEQQIMHLS
jgi:transcription elongation GreA/GreB family factor